MHRSRARPIALRPLITLMTLRALRALRANAHPAPRSGDGWNHSLLNCGSWLGCYTQVRDGNACIGIRDVWGFTAVEAVGVSSYKEERLMGGWHTHDHRYHHKCMRCFINKNRAAFASRGPGTDYGGARLGLGALHATRSAQPSGCRLQLHPRPHTYQHPHQPILRHSPRGLGLRRRACRRDHLPLLGIPSETSTYHGHSERKCRLRA